MNRTPSPPRLTERPSFGPILWLFSVAVIRGLLAVYSVYMSVQRKRAYTKTRRAQLEEETRQRITEATVQLHREVGPARTTISAIAERAGVQRLTVYRHFPDARTLLGACSAHWRAGHPAPDPSGWPAIADPEERLRTAVAAFYAYYRGDEAMIAKVRRD